MNEQQSTLTTGRNELQPAHKQAVAIDIEDLVVKYGSKRAVDGLTSAWLQQCYHSYWHSRWFANEPIKMSRLRVYRCIT